MKRSKLPTLLAIALLIAGSLAPTLSVQAEETPESLLRSFEGPLVLGRDNMNLAFTFSKSDGKYQATLISSGMGIYGMPADTVEVDGLDVKIAIPRLDVEFTGTLRLDDSGENVIRIDGDWFQFSEMVPVVLLPVEEPSY